MLTHLMCERMRYMLTHLTRLLLRWMGVVTHTAEGTKGPQIEVSLDFQYEILGGYMK